MIVKCKKIMYVPQPPIKSEVAVKLKFPMYFHQYNDDSTRYVKLIAKKEKDNSLVIYRTTLIDNNHYPPEVIFEKFNLDITIGKQTLLSAGLMSILDDYNSFDWYSSSKSKFNEAARKVKEFL